MLPKLGLFTNHRFLEQIFELYLYITAIIAVCIRQVCFFKSFNLLLSPCEGSSGRWFYFFLEPKLKRRGCVSYPRAILYACKALDFWTYENLSFYGHICSHNNSLCVYLFTYMYLIDYFNILLYF